MPPVDRNLASAIPAPPISFTQPRFTAGLVRSCKVRDSVRISMWGAIN